MSRRNVIHSSYGGHNERGGYHELGADWQNNPVTPEAASVCTVWNETLNFS